MCCGNEGLSGIVVNMSRCAGTCVGTVTAAGKKIAGVMTSGVRVVGRLLTRPVDTAELIAAEQTESVSKGFDIGARDEQETGQEKLAKSIISTLESDLSAVRGQLQEIQSKAKKTQSRIALQLSELRSEKESLLTELKQARSQANKNKAVLQASAAAYHDENVRTEKQLSQSVSKVEVPSHPAVMEEQVRAAVFDNETQRIIFIRALSDIANRDAAARADAARTIAGIRHELSVRILVGQMASEPSAQVRQEYIKALTTLRMSEGLGAVEQALSDRAALVRLAAVWGLYRLSGTESGPALVRMLSDKDIEVRRRAVTCIGWLGQEELAVELLPLLDDSSVSVRLAVVEAMGNLRCRRVVTALIERLNDPEKAVRKAVLGALKIITGKKMSGPFPRDKKSLQRLIARWRGWWKEEQLG